MPRRLSDLRGGSDRSTVWRHPQKQLPVDQLFTAQKLHNLGLHGIGILKFIDHQHRNPRSGAATDLRKIAQQISCPQQQIIKVEQPRFLLALFVRTDGMLSDAQRHQSAAHGLPDFVVICGTNFRKLFDLCFEFADC